MLSPVLNENLGGILGAPNAKWAIEFPWLEISQDQKDFEI